LKGSDQIKIDYHCLIFLLLQYIIAYNITKMSIIYNKIYIFLNKKKIYISSHLTCVYINLSQRNTNIIVLLFQ